MKTPVYDYVKSYCKKDTVRLHMPGHKGKSFLGFEKYDLTEIDGADVLYSPEGIIKESEDNATSLFSSLHTFYSTEGSTLCIKAMLSLVCKSSSERPLILAARNVHKAFIYGAALLDFDIKWMYSKEASHLCSCKITKRDVEEYILSSEKKPTAVYLTSPDYLGNTADIKGIAEICHRQGVLLLVDNAHGAYLHFLKKDSHPISLGADMCCDSAHKTLPVLTGGAYLHLGKGAKAFLPDVRDALSLHASTSPSYLVLQSLDLCNRYLSASYREALDGITKKIKELKAFLDKKAIPAFLNEPLKLTLEPLSFGYTGNELAGLLSEKGIYCEFHDRDVLVMMFTPESSQRDFSALYDFFEKLEKRKAEAPSPLFSLSKAEKALSIREAVFSPSEYVNAKDSVGRICAEASVACPPAVPLCVSGEIITKEIADAFEFFGFEKVKVVK